MGKRGPKPKEVDPVEVERLARSGYQNSEIAKKLNISHETYYQRIGDNPEIAEAYKKGRDFFLDYIKKTRSQQILEALDDLIAQRNPAAVIFASKTILGLQETVQHNHTANGQPLANEERLKELEAKRRALLSDVVDVVSEKEHDTI